MNKGDIVNIKLTSEIGMIIEVLACMTTGYINGYQVRTPDYRIVKFANFEIEPRQTT